MSNFSEFLSVLDDDPFEEYPVDVRTFVHDNHFLGQPELSEIQYAVVEAGSQIYRLQDLKRFMPDRAEQYFKDNTKNEVILQCGKGSGKDFVSTVTTAYVVYKLLCLKDPAKYFGKPSGDAIDIINVAVNAQQARNVFFKGFRLKIERSPWFAGKYNAKVDSFEFDKAVTVYSGHSERESHEGLNLIMAVLDEISGFAQESTSGNENAKTGDAIYKAFRASVDSRFPDFGKVLLLSFPRYQGDFISKRYDEVIAEKATVLRKHDFLVNPELGDIEDNRFTIEWEEDHIELYKIPKVYAIKRPTWDVNPTRTVADFEQLFYADYADAIMRFACMPSYASDAFFKQRDKLEACMTLRNPIDSAKRIDSTFTPKPDTIYYIHSDLAQKVDKCAIAIAHVDKWVMVKTFNDYQRIVPEVIVDAVVWWEPRKEGAVDLSAVKDWIIDFRRQGFRIGMASFDRWNSFDIQQELKAVGIKTDTLSVAKQHYEDLLMLVYEERINMPHIDLLLDELGELRIVSDKKVDHPRKKSKDLSDAMCGAVYNAISLTPRNLDQEVEIYDYSKLAKKQDKEKMANGVIVAPPAPPEVREFLGNLGML